MNNQVFGAYLVVRIQSKNRNDLGKYECVPNSWVTVKDNYDNIVVFGYPLEDRIHTRFRVIEYQPLDKKWPTIFGEVVFDTDSQEEAFRFIETKTEQDNNIHDQSKDTNKQDDKEVKLVPSSIKTIQPIDQPKNKLGHPRKRKLSDQETPLNNKNGEELEKKLEILEAQELIRTASLYASDFDDVEAVVSSTPKSSQNLTKPDAIQILPNEKDNALEGTNVNKKNDQKIIQRPRRKSTRPTKNHSESYVEFSEDDLDRYIALEETHVNKKKAQKIIQRPRRKSTRPRKNHSESYMEFSDDDLDRSVALEETHVNKKNAQKIIQRPRRKSTRSTINYSESYVEFCDDDLDRSVALEETHVNKKNAQKIIQRPRRKSTRPTNNHSESYVEFLDEDLDRCVALEESHANKKNAQKIAQRPRRKSTRPIKYHSESYVEFSDEDFDRSVNKPDDTQILRKETDNDLEESHANKKKIRKISQRPRRKSTRPTNNHSESYVEFLDEDLDRCVALGETHVNKKNAQKIAQRPRRKSTRPIKYHSESYVEFSDEDFDRSVNKPDDTQIVPNETDNALEETHVNKKNAQKITQRPRRKSTRPTKNLSEAYVEFSDADFDRSDDSDYAPEIVLPELPRPLGQFVPAVDQDINMSLLNDQVYSECYNFYVEFNESYQKSMSILDNAENYLQNVISRHKDNVAAKAKQPSPSPSYQKPYAIISPNMFSHPQPLLQERSSITEEDTRWTVRYPEPGPGIIELIPNSGVYVSEKGLKKCKSKCTGTTKFTRGLLQEVFTDEALSNCSFTGITRKKIAPKPCLDPKARETFVDYVLKYSTNKGWEKADPKVITNCIRNRLHTLSRHG